MTIRDQLSRAVTIEDRCNACATLRRQIRWFSPTSIFDLAAQARDAICQDHKNPLDTGLAKGASND